MLLPVINIALPRGSTLNKMRLLINFVRIQEKRKTAYGVTIKPMMRIVS